MPTYQYRQEFTQVIAQEIKEQDTFKGGNIPNNKTARLMITLTKQPRFTIHLRQHLNVLEFIAQYLIISTIFTISGYKFQTQ
jgi:hypothetical protein